VLWVNYNSIHIITIIKKSLDAIFQLDYPWFELIIVDNGSTDGSKEAIEKHLNSKKTSRLKVKFIKLKKNWGFAGGINIAYKARDRKSKYVTVLSNDVVSKLDYLRQLVTFLEDHKEVGVVQGLVVKLGKNHIIDSAGFFINEAITLFAPFLNKPTYTFRKPAYVSYVEGTMPVYNVEAVTHALGGDNVTLYVPNAFVYYLDDVFLSLMLWSHGYKCTVLPIVTGEHFRMAVTMKYHKSLPLLYYGLRNKIALLYMTNSRDKERFFLKQIRSLILGRASLSQRQVTLNALIDGIRLGKELREKYGIINLYAAPIVRTPIKERLLI
jgi:GT2 family glycosyltransferase